MSPMIYRLLVLGGGGRGAKGAQLVAEMGGAFEIFGDHGGAEVFFQGDPEFGG